MTNIEIYEEWQVIFAAYGDSMRVDSLESRRLVTILNVIDQLLYKHLIEKADKKTIVRAEKDMKHEEQLPLFSGVASA